MDEKATYEDLETKIAYLQKQADKITFSEKLTQTLFDISNAVTSTIDLSELYRSIYTSLDKLMGLPNFYIAIYQEEINKLHIPFFVDQFDGHSEYEEYFSEYNSLTGEVLRAKHPLFQYKRS